MSKPSALAYDLRVEAKRCLLSRNQSSADLLEAAADALDATTAALAEYAKADSTDAKRMRLAIVEARRRLAKGRALWNGPCHECDAVLAQALTVNNYPADINKDADHEAFRVLADETLAKLEAK